MPRVKRGTIGAKRRRNVLKATSGYRFGRSTKERQANEARLHAGRYSFAHRKDKKGDFRTLWQIRISAAVKPLGYSYSKFMGALKAKNIELDRKVLSQLAAKDPASFASLVKEVM